MSILPGPQPYRARSTIRQTNVGDSWTQFLRENAVTSLPPIDLINRYQLSPGPKRLSRREEVLRPAVHFPEILFSPRNRRLPIRRFREKLTLSPEVVSKSIIQPLLPLSCREMKPRRMHIASLSPRTLPCASPTFAFVSPELSPVVTVQSHMRHY